jgi:glutamate racemase
VSAGAGASRGAGVRPAARPIGVFDSGVGGLTVLGALRARLPAEDFLYLGDTARLPYGTKSADTVARYSVQCAGLLVDRGIDALVVACNTASAFALPALAAAYPDLPIVGVVEPGAEAAVAATRNGHVAVIATEGTVRGGAYAREIRRRRPDARVTSVACPLFVALAEEGWTSGTVVEAVARRYLEPVFGASDAPDTLVLGCTHFPVFAAVLREVVGPDVAIVDSAATTADAVATLLAARGRGHASGTAGTLRLLATDGPERFARVSAVFGIAVAADEVELVDLAQPPSAAGTS